MCRKNPTYTNGDVLGSRKEPVDQNAHEGRVQAELDLEVGELGVSHALGDDNGADGDACGRWWVSESCDAERDWRQEDAHQQQDLQ
jgi:hypothetical protein